MTREEQIERVRDVLGPPPFAFVDEQGLTMWAERIVDALVQPVEVTNDPGHDWRPTRMKDTGTDPPRYLWRCDVCHLDQWSADLPDALDPDHPCESVQAKIDRMRDPTERVSERNQRIKELRASPVEGMDELREDKTPPRGQLPPDVEAAAQRIHTAVWRSPYRSGEGPMHHAGGPYWHDELLRQADRWERMAADARLCAEALPDV